MVMAMKWLNNIAPITRVKIMAVIFRVLLIEPINLRKANRLLAMAIIKGA